MAVSVKPITLWRRSLQSRAGALAESLSPLAERGGDAKVLMSGFAVGRVIGRGFSAIYGFADEDGERRAVPLLEKAAGPARRTAAPRKKR